MNFVPDSRYMIDVTGQSIIRVENSQLGVGQYSSLRNTQPTFIIFVGCVPLLNPCARRMVYNANIMSNLLMLSTNLL